MVTLLWRVRWLAIPACVLAGDVLFGWRGLPPRHEMPQGLLTSLAFSCFAWWSLWSLAIRYRAIRWLIVTLLPPFGLMLGSAWQLARIASFPDSAILLYTLKEPRSAWAMSASQLATLAPYFGFLLLGCGGAALFWSTRLDATPKLKPWIAPLVLAIASLTSLTLPEPRPYMGSPYVGDVRLANAMSHTAQRILSGDAQQLPHVTQRDTLPPTTSPRPTHDVLVIITESLRPDHMGSYGYTARQTTPALDKFAANSPQELFVFERAHSNCAYTLLSVSSILTGLAISAPPERLMRAPLLWHYAHAHDLHTFFYSPQDLQWANMWDFLLLYDPPAGLYTAAESDAPVVNEMGIDDLMVARLAADHVRSLPAQTRMLGVLQTNATHFPFLAPHDTPWPVNDIVARYDAGVRHTDAAIGAMLDALAETGRLERTLILVLSDHGEHIRAIEQPDHPALKQGRLRVTSCHPTITQIPMLLYVPRALQAELNVDPAQLERNTRAIVSTLDALPTVLDAWRQTPLDTLPGSSLLRPLEPAREAICFSPTLSGVGAIQGFAIYGPEHTFYDRADLAHGEYFKTRDTSSYEDWSFGAPLTEESAVYPAFEEALARHPDALRLMERIRAARRAR